MRLSDKDDNTPKTMNTHLHILEPYTNLYRVWPDARLRERLENLVGIFLDRIESPRDAPFGTLFRQRLARDEPPMSIPTVTTSRLRGCCSKRRRP